MDPLGFAGFAGLMAASGLGIEGLGVQGLGLRAYDSGFRV